MHDLYQSPPVQLVACQEKLVNVLLPEHLGGPRQQLIALLCTQTLLIACPTTDFDTDTNSKVNKVRYTILTL